LIRAGDFTQDTFKIKKTKLQDEQAKPVKTCPACNYKQSPLNQECEACGIIFEKYDRYTPIKAITNKFLAPTEITEIRNLQKYLTKIQHDTSSKTELILRCQKEELLDMAAYYIKKQNDKKGIALIKKISTLSYNKSNNYKAETKTQTFIGQLLEAPFLLAAAILLLLLLGFTLFISSYLR
jgi:hypothetical protein